MNAYYDKTFVIGSELALDIGYFDSDDNPLNFDEKFKVVDLVLTNVENNRKFELKNVGAVRGNEVSILIYSGEWGKAAKEFFKDDISDIYGYGDKWHAYAVWLSDFGGNNKICVMRGKAKMVRAGE